MKALASILTALGAAIALSAQPLNFVFESEIDTLDELNAIVADATIQKALAPATLPASGNAWAADTYYAGAISANYTIASLPASPTNGVTSIRWSGTVSSGPVTITLPTAYRIATGGTTTSFALPDGNHAITLSYNNSRWELYDSDGGALPNGSVDTAQLVDGAVTVAKIDATGTASSSTYLRGDGSWQAVSGGSSATVGASMPSFTSAGFYGSRSTGDFWYRETANSYWDLAAGTYTDGDAPTLSSASGAATGETTADLAVTTNEAGGTLYWYVSTSGTAPSGTDLKAGTGATYATSASISATGAQAASATGLTAATTYYLHALQTDAATNDSAIATSASWTQDSASSSVTRTYRGSAVDSADLTTYTFANFNYGAEGERSHVIVGVIGRDSAISAGVVTVTIDGVSATELASNSFNDSANSKTAAIYGAAVPTTSSGDIVVTFNQPMVRAAIAVWTVSGVASLTPVDTASVGANPNASLSLNLTRDGSNAVAIAVVIGDATKTGSWTGLTEDGYVTVESAAAIGGASDVATGTGELAISSPAAGSGVSVLLK